MPARATVGSNYVSAAGLSSESRRSGDKDARKTLPVDGGQAAVGRCGFNIASRRASNTR